MITEECMIHLATLTEDQINVLMYYGEFYGISMRQCKRKINRHGINEKTCVYFFMYTGGEVLSGVYDKSPDDKFAVYTVMNCDICFDEFKMMIQLGFSPLVKVSGDAI